MSPEKTKRTSKFMSLVLRHQPEKIGITLSADGWVSTNEFLSAMRRHGYSMSIEDLEYVVENNDKKRFVIEKGRIRASQGHSVEVDLQLEPKQPPFKLYHGTAESTVELILKDGIKKMGRTHVHLSSDIETAKKVGGRHGKPVVLTVAAGDMWGDDYPFFLSANGVWLTDHVPAGYICE